MLRIAMWSGPRNLSTALMRSFSSRADCVVSDEPFYASFLDFTGFDHPGRDEVLASQSRDWQQVAAAVSSGPAPLPQPVWYQKHMAQHMRDEMLGPWVDCLEHVFLVRHPARVIASYLKVRSAMTLADTGLPWQLRLYEYLRQRRGKAPLVIDAVELQQNPEATLKHLCKTLGLSWDPAMLSWPAGPHPQDGVWAPYWYAGTWKSTGFVSPSEDDPPLPRPKVLFLEEAVSLYERLRTCSKSEIQPMIS